MFSYGTFATATTISFLATWENSLVVLDIMQTPSYIIIFVIYLFLRWKKQTTLKIVLDFESPSKFWAFQITYRLPVGLALLCQRPIKKIVQVHGVSHSRSGRSPAGQKSLRTLGTRLA